MNNTQEKCLLLSMADFYSGASGIRTHNLINLLKSLDDFETVCYMFSDKPFNTFLVKEEPNIAYYSLGNPSSQKNKVKKYLCNYWLHNRIKKILKIIQPTVLYVYSILPKSEIVYLKKYCKKKNCKLFFDVVEFRSKSDTLTFKQEWTYNRHNRFISATAIDLETNGVSCPTYYLKKHFTDRGVSNIFVLPITTNVSRLPKFNKNIKKEKINFLYAGTPSNKRDLLANIIDGFVILPEKYKNKVNLVICGASTNEIINNEGLSIKSYKESLTFTRYLGKISKDKLYKIYPLIDFTLLLKDPDKQFSKAGFPTKLSESFSIGIPMITNISGDIGFYLEDGKNGYISKDFSPEEFSKQIMRAIDDYDFFHNELSRNALETAKNELDVNKYKNKFKKFINYSYGDTK